MSEENRVSSIEFLLEVEGTFEQRGRAVGRALDAYNELLEELRSNRSRYGCLPAYEPEL